MYSLRPRWKASLGTGTVRCTAAVATVVVWLIAMAAGALAEDRLRIITSGDYHPFVFSDASGALAGFEIDFANALCAVMAARCQFIDLPFEQTIPALIAGQGDAIIASMSITEERKKRVAFTNSYYRNPMQFIARRGFDRPITREGLMGAKIGVTPEGTNEAYARRAFGGAAEIVTMGGENSQDNLYRALSRGEVDLVLGDSLAMWQFTASPQGRDFAFVGAPIYVDEEIGIAVRNEDDTLRRRLNAAIARIRLDGTYQKINAKYFPFSIY